jgi:hypothetical protein
VQFPLLGGVCASAIICYLDWGTQAMKPRRCSMITHLLVALTLCPLVLAAQKPFWINEDASHGTGDELSALEPNYDEIFTAFAGVTTFAHLPLVNCLHPGYAEESKEKFDIAIVGAPFDTSVTYRPGCVPDCLQSGVILEQGLDLQG